MRKIIFTALTIFIAHQSFSQTVTIKVDSTGKKAISPYIYGRNNTFDKPAQFYKDAGLRFARTNGGNNATGYNWRNRLSIHPDWYNNVYVNDWDATAKNINDNFPDMQGMFAFQLLGRVASNQNNNFNDWAYNQSQYWSGVGQNLAGGGIVNTNGGSKALVDGNIDLFSKVWPADSSVAILNHWFGTNGKGFNKNQFQYWSMDNEGDIWNGTHDWAMPTLISASAFMDRYIELAKKAKALYPGIKLCGPVTTSEWQWYKWSNENIYINGRYYPWIEYFIKRLGDEYKATGIKLVDVIDIHNYPFYNNDKEALQGHRIYYDTNYDYPGSNGIYTSTGGWNTSLKKQYIFKRIEGWLNEHFGVNHGITAGVSEWGTMTKNSNPNIESVIYASHLGTFANNGVELFAPWNWSIGMWETLHLFSRYGKEFRIQSTSNMEDTVSAYSSINANADSMTIFLVNRSITTQQNVSVKVSNMPIYGAYNKLSLYNLPKSETFVSHTTNALTSGTVSALDSIFTATLPPLSVTAVLLQKKVQPVFIRAGKNPVCQGENNIAFSIPNTQGAHYKWTYSGIGATIANDTLHSISVNFSATATSGTLTVNAKYPADSTWALDVTVGTPVAQPDVITGKSPVCKGDTNITYSVTNDPTVSYAWTYSGTGATIFNRNSNTATINYSKTATSGTLKVTVANTTGCVDGNTNNRTLSIIVSSLPTPGAIVASKNPVLQGDNGITYSVTNDLSSTYNWTYSGTGATISNSASNIATVDYSSSATSGSMSVTATNTSGCASSNIIEVTVNSNPNRINSVCADDLLSVNYNSGKSEARISYHLNAPAPVKIEIYELQGRLIKRLEDSFKSPGAYDIYTSTTGMAKGIYIIRYNAGQTKVQKKLLLTD